jgi:hypothetical protein
MLPEAAPLGATQGFVPLTQTCPTAALPSGVPLTDHVTLVSVEFATAAVKDCCWLGESVAVPGATVTVTPLVIVTVAETLEAPPATPLAVACIVTGFVTGKSTGAV